MTGFDSLPDTGIMVRLRIFVFFVSAFFISVNASVDNINYNVVNTLLQSPIRKELDKGSSIPDMGVARENFIENPFKLKPIVVSPVNNSEPKPPVSQLDDVTVQDAPKKEEPSSMYEDTVKTLAGIYQECTQKIDKRVESVLNWKFTRTNTENDLIQLKDYVVLLYRCLKVQSFRYLDNVINEDTIAVTPFADLVRDGRSLDRDSQVMNMGTNAINGKLSVPWYSEKGRVTSQYVAEVVDNDWSTLLLDRMTKLLQSHSMKFSLDENAIQGRGRRRDYKMFAMMVMGFMIMATILIPMGFQFLTVLGGKSLLMAKMALIMSAINGLKKIATTPVGYGFYHTAPDGHHDHHHGFHDKIFKIKQNAAPEFL